MQNQNFENYDYEKDFLNKFEEEKKKYKRPNILICGYTGAGKTSIIQALLGKDLVPDNEIKDAERGTMDYKRYENELIGIWDSMGLEPKKGEQDFIRMTEEFIRERQDKSNNVDDHIHIFWYVISAGIERITETDLKIINLFPKESTLIIISKIDKDTRNKTVEAYKKKLIGEGNISEDKIIYTTDIEGGKIGIKELYENSLKIMPEAYKIAFEEAQRINIEKAIQIKKEKDKKANYIILKYINEIRIYGDINKVNIKISSMLAELSNLYGLNEKYTNNFALPLLTLLYSFFYPKGMLELFNIENKDIDLIILISSIANYCKEKFEELSISIIENKQIETIDNSNKNFFNAYMQKYRSKILCYSESQLANMINKEENLILLIGDLAKNIYKIKSLKNNIWAIIISSIAALVPLLIGFAPIGMAASVILGVGVTAALGIRAVNVLLALIKAGSLIFGGKVFGAKRILDMLRNNYDILYDKNKSLLIRKL
ncbi:GTPase domain-containing protein [uncultured Brachyspira sp.]|uniref:GTPase n=1 Tax=uncultured Brachyspira sp. TaxID=221953 RepID=UPI00259452A8|nr:GTPase domain-containing protein [uncultured Brachyspira sp.]